MVIAIFPLGLYQLVPCARLCFPYLLILYPATLKVVAKAQLALPCLSPSITLAGKTENVDCRALTFTGMATRSGRLIGKMGRTLHMRYHYYKMLYIQTRKQKTKITPCVTMEECEVRLQDNSYLTKS